MLTTWEMTSVSRVMQWAAVAEEESWHQVTQEPMFKNVNDRISSSQ